MVRKPGGRCSTKRARPFFPELMAELDATKQTMVSGLAFRRDRKHRRSPTPLPWITERNDPRYLRSVVKKIVIAAKIRTELSFTSFRHGGFTEGADSDLTDAELRAAGRHRSARQLPTYAKRTRKQLISGTKKRREERTKAADLSEYADRLSEWLSREVPKLLKSLVGAPGLEPGTR